MNTRQAVFDVVSKHLLKQSQKSLDPSGFGCAYRGLNGTKCAIGALIADEHFDPNSNNASVECDATILMLEKSGVDVDAVGTSFLQNLQDLHDYTDSLVWDAKLSQFARTNGLEFKR